uniref:ATP synthase F(1) complex subunit delta, mitochondrial n=1 Tax=Leptobrachium leishanense TaxID=445787 RepID=A0A8C5P7T3_9ANUR
MGRLAGDGHQDMHGPYTAMPSLCPGGNHDQANAVQRDASDPGDALRTQRHDSSPDGIVFYSNANVKQVDVPTLTGVFGILPSHVPTLQVLRPGLVIVITDDGIPKKYFVSSGSVTVNIDSSVQLLAEEAAPLDMFDLSTAKSNLERAQADLLSASDEVAKAEAQIVVEANDALVKSLE